MSIFPFLFGIGAVLCIECLAAESRLAEKYGVAVRISRLSHSVYDNVYFRFTSHHFEFLQSGNVGVVEMEVGSCEYLPPS